jgi:hypothetical protein
MADGAEAVRIAVPMLGQELPGLELMLAFRLFPRRRRTVRGTPNGRIAAQRQAEPRA